MNRSKQELPQAAHKSSQGHFATTNRNGSAAIAIRRMLGGLGSKVLVYTIVSSAACLPLSMPLAGFAQETSHANGADGRPAQTGALPTGDQIISYQTCNDGIRRPLVLRRDGSTYVLGDKQSPTYGPNNILNRPLGEEPRPNYGPNNILNRPLGEEPPPTYGRNNILNQPLGEEPRPNYGPNNILNRPLGEEPPPTYGRDNILNRPLGEDGVSTRDRKSTWGSRTSYGAGNERQANPYGENSFTLRTVERPGTGTHPVQPQIRGKIR